MIPPLQQTRWSARHLRAVAGAEGFLDHTRAFIEQRDQTLQRNKELSEQDAHIPGID